MSCSCLWANIHVARGPLPPIAWLVGGGVGVVTLGGEQGAGGCKASCEFPAGLALVCQHRKTWCTHVLGSISRGGVG